jgi:hypothetical protein
MSDRGDLANAIEDAGIPRDKAERIALAIIDAVHGSVATKTETGALMGQLTAVRTELKGDIAEMSAALSAARNQLAGDVATMHTELREAISLNGRRLMMRMTLLLVVLAAVVFAVFQYLPRVLSR